MLERKVIEFDRKKSRTIYRFIALNWAFKASMRFKTLGIFDCISKLLRHIRGTHKKNRGILPIYLWANILHPDLTPSLGRYSAMTLKQNRQTDTKGLLNPLIYLNQKTGAQL